MCLDPHAVAKIETRMMLDSLEQLLVDLANSNANASAAGLAELAVLRHRLSWCNECYSRHRSQLLLSWIQKRAADLVLRVIEASFYQQSASVFMRWSIGNAWSYNPIPANGGGLLSEGVRRVA
jgi:hypothetical protein